MAGKDGIDRWHEDVRDFPNRIEAPGVVNAANLERADDSFYRGLADMVPEGDWGRYGGGPPPGQGAHVSRPVGRFGREVGGDKAAAGEGTRSGRSAQYGKTITVQPGGVSAAGVPVGAVLTPVFDDDFSWTLVVQPTNPLAAGQSLVYTITYTVGDVPFVKKFTGPASLAMAKSMMFFGRSMKVDVQLVGSTAIGGGPPATVSVAVARGVVREWSWLCPFWVAQPDATQPSGQLDGSGLAGGATQAGSVLALQAVLTTAPGGAGPWYLLLLDSNGAPAAGTQPIPGGFSAPFTAAGQSVTFDDELIAGTLYYASGLFYAISTRPDQYQPPVGGALTVAAKIGR